LRPKTLLASLQVASNAVAESIQTVTGYDCTAEKGDLGCYTEMTHHIITKYDNPVRVPYRRVSPQHWDELREYLKQWMEKGVLRESSSAYDAPIVIVHEKRGEIRMCIDYRGLNAKTCQDAYPIPRIEKAPDVLRGAKFFCSLNLAHGYYQVPMAAEDINKTAFRLGTGGLYEFSRICFVFGDLKFRSLLVYLDHILVFVSKVAETLARLEVVLQRLQKANLKVKPSKCQLFHRKLRYLGHFVSEDGVEPDPSIISAIIGWPWPSNEKEVH